MANLILNDAFTPYFERSEERLRKETHSAPPAVPPERTSAAAFCARSAHHHSFRTSVARTRRRAGSGGLGTIGDKHRACCDQRHADPIDRGQLFAKEDDAEDRNQHDTELVDRRDLRRLAELERAEIAEP
jgi:hypothetical protein